MQVTMETARAAATPKETIERILTLARRQLGMDVAFVAAIENGLEKIRATEGDAESFGLDGGISIPLEESYCNLMVKGQLANVVPDAKIDEWVKDLAVTTSADIGAYVGVPVHLWDGRLYGTLCCLSHAADPSLDDRDARFMQVLAAVIGDQVEYQTLQDERKNMLSDRVQGALSRGVDMVFQPVYDLEHGDVFAYEALARFQVEPYRPPSEWFADAAEVGLGVELELAAIDSALVKVEDLPEGVRLALNVSPADRALAAVLQPPRAAREPRHHRGHRARAGRGLRRAQRSAPAAPEPGRLDRHRRRRRRVREPEPHPASRSRHREARSQPDAGHCGRSGA